ncbi:PucR C-terminal helix-turn-helix domain-containing protein [Sporobacter termitidis DSM 10068]|uniref:PucR C-terminal helix-turn-helix domain-containing protein n=1 Tax=Sporobacter termitidis DSM 10068 TaxID=1123282 RepID=A0A1M5ZBN2_9FIRM|nr:helix-turn-helix domain-containing protein [Sporobacter termitidis]SHI21655.1 PucR C-terminal helix-turn-helix domain-containing protein [Sporobacter termitidis DSM 10068]
MPVTVKAIREQVGAFRPDYISPGGADNQIEKILPLRPDADTGAAGTLYVGLASQLPAQCPQNVVCVGDAPVPEAFKKLQFVSLTVLPAGTDPDDVYACLCNFMLEGDRALSAAANLLSSLAKARGLESIVAIAYKALGNPIIVSDKSWKALAIASDVKETDDVAWNEFMTTGALSLEVVSMNIKEKLTDRIEQSETPFWCKEANMKYPRLFCRVAVGSRPVATVAVIEYYRPFVERDYLMLSMLASAISAEMQKNKFLHYTRGLLYEEFIVDLIEGRVKNQTVIEEKIKSLNLGLKRFIHVVTIDIRAFDVTYFSIPYMRDYLEKMITGSKALIYNDNITMVSSYNGEREIFESDALKLRDFLKDYKLHAGVSRPFTKLDALKEHYCQSLEALDLGTHIDSEITVYAYDDYAIYHIAKACADVSDLKKFCHPKLEYLMEYDTEHKTSFTDSLYTYLKHSRNITNTAKALHLHRNSMIYHLKRIEEILNFSLSDNEMLLHIELSFRLMEYDKKFNRKIINSPHPLDSPRGGPRGGPG